MDCKCQEAVYCAGFFFFSLGPGVVSILAASAAGRRLRSVAMSIGLGFVQFPNQPEIDDAAAIADNGDPPPHPGSPRFNQLPFLRADEVEEFLNVDAPNRGQNQPLEDDLDLAVPDQVQNQAHEELGNLIQRHPAGIFGVEYWEVYSGLDYIDEVVKEFAQEEELEDDEKVVDSSPSDNSIQPYATGIDSAEYGEVDASSDYSDELVNADPEEEESEKDENEEKVLDSEPSEPPSKRIRAVDNPSVELSPSISVDNKLLHEIFPPNQSIAMMGVQDVSIRDADASLPFGSVLERSP